MLSKENFTESRIRELQKQSRRDPGIIERMIYAFGLLEALAGTGLPFIFKGGTSLMLLLEHPMRLSTDIDILVDPSAEVDDFIRMAASVFPFKSQTEQRRSGRSGIVKRHFKFTYESILTHKDSFILLDVLYEHSNYSLLLERPISNELLLTEGRNRTVLIPDANSLLGDKLTAFAPHTSGVLIGEGKNAEVMKQAYDVCTLFSVMTDFEKVKNSYDAIVASESGYRGGHCSREDCLLDSFLSALCIAAHGKIRQNDFRCYLEGARAIHNHVFSENFTMEIASKRAPLIMYLSALLLSGGPFVRLDRIDGQEKYADIPELLYLRYLKRADPISYAYAVRSLMIMDEAGIDVSDAIHGN